MEEAGNRARPETFDVLNRAVDFLGQLLAADASPATKAAQVALVKALEALPKTPGAVPPAAPAAAAAPAPEPPPESAPVQRMERALVRAITAETVRIPMSKMDALLRQAEEMISVKQLLAARTAKLGSLRARIDTWQAEWSRLRERNGGASGEAPVEAFLDWNHDFMSELGKELQALARASAGDERSVRTSIDGLLGGAKRLVMLPVRDAARSLPKASARPGARPGQRGRARRCAGARWRSTSASSRR